ncbi:MAG: methionyl-tRNA formyltransferase [bacterium]
MRVIFMGSPDFAVPTLDALLGDPEFDVVQVVTQPDRPKGRGKKLTATPVKTRALESGVPVVAMTKSDYAHVASEIAAWEPDFVVVAAFGVILKSDILGTPRYGCVNLHASLLPKYRGVSPVQAAILAGDRVTGCTTMLMDAGVDTGDMLLTDRVVIEPDDTAGSLEKKLAAVGAPLVLETLRGLQDGTVSPRKQDADLATYTKKIKKQHGAIRWSDSAERIARLVRAMSPWPTAYTSFEGKRLIILEGAVRPGGSPAAAPGTILATAPLAVATGSGVFVVSRVKVEGKRETPAAAFAAGYRVTVGDRLGGAEDDEE